MAWTITRLRAELDELKTCCLTLEETHRLQNEMATLRERDQLERAVTEAAAATYWDSCNQNKIALNSAVEALLAHRAKAPNV